MVGGPHSKATSGLCVPEGAGGSCYDQLPPPPPLVKALSAQQFPLLSVALTAGGSPLLVLACLLFFSRIALFCSPGWFPAHGHPTALAFLSQGTVGRTLRAELALAGSDVVILVQL